MKTISGQCVSVKDISVSKAAKILSKFVSADNGASHAINAYLHRASLSFNELNHLHKELHSHKNKKRHTTKETASHHDDPKSTHLFLKCGQEQLDASVGTQNKLLHAQEKATPKGDQKKKKMKRKHSEG